VNEIGKINVAADIKRDLHATAFKIMFYFSLGKTLPGVAALSEA
jgi:hypothetical protein